MRRGKILDAIHLNVLWIFGTVSALRRNTIRTHRISKQVRWVFYSLIALTMPSPKWNSICRSSWQWHAKFRSLLLEPLVEFLHHLSTPFPVNLAGRVFAFAQHRMPPFVHQMDHFSITGNFFR